MRILLYIFIISIGIIIGYKDILTEKWMGSISKIQMLCLLFLLFVMGLNIGVNRNIVNIFMKLGYQALVLSIFSIIFSIIGVKLVSKRLGNIKRGERGHDN